MKQVLFRNLIMFVVLLLITLTSVNIMPLPVLAGETQIKGTQYKFDEDCNYVISDAETKQNIAGETQFGQISLDGQISKISDVNGFQAFEVDKEKVSINYKINTKLGVVEDDAKKISNAELDEKMKKGVIIVQTSMDGSHWIVDKSINDILGENKGQLSSPIYESNYVQQTNGCFFRVIVAYKTEKLLENSKFLFFDTSDYEVFKWAEVYKFYIEDKNKGTTDTPDTSKKIVFQDEIYRVKVENKSGYSIEEEPYPEDLHYGWDLGQFTINGYTDNIEDENGNLIILKNAGDQVTLWFSLNQDINKLNGDEYLTINNDKKGYDTLFKSIEPTEFGRGALIIQQTDDTNEAHKPILFKNFLEANTRTGADTKVRLFEEGDYVVVLDYQVIDSFAIDYIESYTLAFNFKIRNSNCMIFARDLGTQNELYDHDITKDGFKLDYANSKYLKVDVEQKIIKYNGTSYSEDTRRNRAANDGKEYSEEGVYMISVKHDYDDDQKTEKVIYVGDSPIIKALSKNNITVAEINNLLAQGYVVEDDGSLVTKKGQKVEDNIDELEEEQQVEDIDSKTEDNTSEEEISESIIAVEKPEPTKEEMEKQEDTNRPTVPIFIVLFVLGGIVVFYKQRFLNKEKFDETKVAEETSDIEKEEE